MFVVLCGVNLHPWGVLVESESPEDILGYIPDWLDLDDPRSAREQLNEHYAHGGGWQAFEGFKLQPDTTLAYPGDPPTRPLAMTAFRKEIVVIYEHAWVAIIQPDGSFEVSRMD